MAHLHIGWQRALTAMDSRAIVGIRTAAAVFLLPDHAAADAYHASSDILVGREVMDFECAIGTEESGVNQVKFKEGLGIGGRT